MLGVFWGHSATPVIKDHDLELRPAYLSDYAAWHRTRQRSRVFLKPFEPSWTEADLSISAYRQRLRRARREAAKGREHSFLIFYRGQLAGGLTISNIRRRAACFANLGYWMDIEHKGHGIMTRAVGQVLPFVYETLNLNRLNAACLPHNTASRRVLEKNGFVEEGFAEHYLQIDGRWQDHVLFGLTHDRYLAAKSGQLETR